MPCYSGPPDPPRVDKRELDEAVRRLCTLCKVIDAAERPDLIEAAGLKTWWTQHKAADAAREEAAAAKKAATAKKKRDRENALEKLQRVGLTEDELRELGLTKKSAR